jgi:hypothetical protein
VGSNPATPTDAVGGEPVDGAVTRRRVPAVARLDFFAAEEAGVHPHHKEYL